jgi:hypothetical protein
MLDAGLLSATYGAPLRRVPDPAGEAVLFVSG